MKSFEEWDKSLNFMALELAAAEYGPNPDADKIFACKIKVLSRVVYDMLLEPARHDNRGYDPLYFIGKKD